MLQHSHIWKLIPHSGDIGNKINKHKKVRNTEIQEGKKWAHICGAVGIWRGSAHLAGETLWIVHNKQRLIQTGGYPVIADLDGIALRQWNVTLHFILTAVCCCPLDCLTSADDAILTHLTHKEFYYIYMNICQATHLEIIPKYFTMEIRALFSASKQTHRAPVISDSEWVTVALHSAFWIST